MSAEEIIIQRTIATVEGLTDQIADLSGERIDQANEALNLSINTLGQITELRVSRVEAALIGPITLIYKDAVYHTLRAYWQASPGLMAILAGIWAVVMVVVQIVKWIIAVVQVIQALKLDDLLASYWPEFEAARQKFRQWIGDLSEAVGWGVDGVLHLMHAAQGFTDVMGGLMGKSYAWMDAEWMIKSGNILERMSSLGSQITERPGEILEILFQGEMRLNFQLSSEFGEKLTSTLTLITGRATSALQGLADVADELTAIQENMPQMIRDNIPSGIFTSLETFSHTIESNILPRLFYIDRSLQSFNNIFAQHSNKLSSLADKLAHPGTTLLGIDDLPDYARLQEEWAVDDVASRLFAQSANDERAAMQPDLDAFALIDEAAAAPLQPLPFMDIESPQRAALHGIVAEPQETWFVGGYDSQY